MRILLVTMAMDIGGAETHILELAKELKRRGNEIFVASNGGKYVEELKDPNCLYRGSSNQRLIDVQNTVKEGHIALWEGKNETQF